MKAYRGVNPLDFLGETGKRMMFLSIGIDHWADHTIHQNYSKLFLKFLTDDGLESNKHINDVGKIEHCLCCFLLWKPIGTPFRSHGDEPNVPGRRHGNVLQARFVDLPFGGLCGQLLLGLRSWKKWHGYSKSLGFSENHIWVCLKMLG